MKLSEIISHGNRFEAAVFDVDAMKARQIILKNSVPLGEMLNAAYYGGRLKRQYINGKNPRAIGFIGSSEMLDCYPKPSKFMLNSNEVDNLRVNEGAILISRSGTVGNVTFVNKTLSKFLVSEHAIRLICKNYSGYVYTYLKSKIGQTLIQSNIYGAVIKEIEPEHLEQIPIPDAPENLKRQIHELIVKSYELRDESNALIDEATQILIDELHLPPIEDFDTQKNFSVKLSNLRGRLDASFHVPIVEKIISHLEKYAAEVTTIADNRISTKVILPGRFKRVYVDEGHGVTFFGGRSIGELNPSDKKYLSFAMHEEKIRDELTIHENYILVTRSGTIGNVVFVPKHWEGWTVTDDIIRLIPNDKICGYVYIWLNTDYANKIIDSLAYGAVVRHIEINHLAAVPIPLLKNVSAQNKINALALAANEKRFEAYELEQTALKILNEEIF